MKNKKWMRVVFEFATFCKWKIFFSVIFAIISVLGGFIPYIAVYNILNIFFEGNPDLKDIIFWSLICFLGYFSKLLFYAFSTTLSHISAYSILEQIRLRLINKLLKAPLGTVLNETSGKFKNVIVDRVETIELPLAHMIPEGISNLILPLFVFSYLLFIDWRMALASLITVPLPLILFSFEMKKFNKKYSDYMKASNHVNSVIVEYINGIEVIKTFNQSSKSYEKFSDSVKFFKDYTLDWFRSTWKLMNFTATFLPSSLLGTIPIGMILYINGSLSPSEFVMCLILSMGIISPLMWFTTAINDLKTIEYAVNDVNKILNIEELKDNELCIDLKDYSINLNDVSFSYNNESNAIDNITLNIPQGEFHALVGPSGGGKSTIARLISRFWDIDSGSIKIGGVDIKDIPLTQLRNIISFVTQDNFLFDCSILENIRIGNSDATDEEVFNIAKKAQCDDFIKKLPNGYHTEAGEAGKKLSGGEMQRITIARTMLKNSPILILDEATAFTDSENEDNIQKSISELTKNKTLIVIAHRLSTIKDADNIVVLNNGKIVEQGTQDYLLRNCNLYIEMWKSHIGSKSWAAGNRKEDFYV